MWVIAALEVEGVNRNASYRKQTNGLENPELHEFGLQPDLAAGVNPTKSAENIQSSTGNIENPTDGNIHIAVFNREHRRVFHANGSAFTGKEKQEPLESQEGCQRYHEGRNTKEGDQPADEEAKCNSNDDADRESDPPFEIVVGYQNDQNGAAHTGGVTGGEIDLAQQKNEDQAHGDHNDRSCLS